MSTSVYPYLSSDELRVKEDESTAKELAWLLISLQETLAELKSGLEDCYALLAPIEPGSTLVLSSPRSESIKGHVTRVGCTLVKGTINLRLKTHPPLSLTLNPSQTQPLPLPSLLHLRSLLNQSLDCIDITRWTGDKSSASFMSSQLRLLHSILLEAITTLKGPELQLIPTHIASNNSSRRASTSSRRPSKKPAEEEREESNPTEPAWHKSPPESSSFSPALPAPLSLTFTPLPSSLLLTLRVLEPLPSSTLSSSPFTSSLSKFAHATGLQRRLEHDEMDDVVSWAPMGEDVRVKEKVRVESSVDPGLVSLGAKLGSLERVVEGLRGGLKVVMGGEGE